MAKGVDPNKDPADNLAALAAQVNGAPELALLLAKGVDINRNPTGRSWSMDSAILARDPVVLEEMLTGKPSLANDSSFDVYEILTSSLPRTEAYADMLGSHGPVDDEAAFVRKLKLSWRRNMTSMQRTPNRQDAIILAVEAHFSTKLIQALLDAGADPNKKNAAGKSAVDIAADTRSVAGVAAARHEASLCGFAQGLQDSRELALGGNVDVGGRYVPHAFGGWHGQPRVDVRLPTHVERGEWGGTY